MLQLVQKLAEQSGIPWSTLSEQLELSVTLKTLTSNEVTDRQTDEVTDRQTVR